MLDHFTGEDGETAIRPLSQHTYAVILNNLIGQQLFGHGFGGFDGFFAIYLTDGN